MIAAVSQSEPDLSSLYAEHIAWLLPETAKVLADCELDHVVISAGTLVAKSLFDDQDWPFRPTPTFAHYLPLEEPDNVLVLSPGKKMQLIRAFTPSYWEGDVPNPWSYALAHAEVVSCDVAKLATFLPKGRVAFVGNDPARGEALGFSAAQINPPALVAGLAAVRTSKTAYERECIRQANQIALVGHKKLADLFLSGTPASELELHLLYLRSTRQSESETPYQNIVAMGKHAGVLHHVYYAKTPSNAASESLLVDAGAKVAGYASDITRTYVRGEDVAAKLFGQLIHGVDALQKRLCQEITVGGEYEALHDKMHWYLADTLRDLGVGLASAEELVNKGITRAFLPHGLGHALGLQVHDVGQKLRSGSAGNPYLRNTSKITVGQVFTMEPGCYFIPSLLEKTKAEHSAAIDWKQVTALARFGGVRIEDNVAVCDSGIVNLTR